MIGRLTRAAAMVLLLIELVDVRVLKGRAETTAPASQQPAAAVSQEFCDYFTTLGTAAQRDFKDLRGAAAYGSKDFNFSMLALPQASSCVVSAESGSYLCTWSDRPAFHLRGDFELLTRSIRACFPSYESDDFESNGEMFFNLVIPAGQTGGPTQVSVNVQRREIWMGIGRIKR